MHNHQPDGHDDGDSTVKELEIVAQYPSHTQAQQAEQAIRDQVISTHVEMTDTPLEAELENAHMGVSTVEIGTLAWMGLAGGLVLGAVLGVLVFAGTITLPGIAPALGAGVTAVVALGAGILGVVGWFIGALVHLFRTSTASGLHDLHAVVDENKWQQVGQTLVGTDALSVHVSHTNSTHNGRTEQRYDHDQAN